MFLGIIAPLLIGALGVLQNTWNKQISERLGLVQAIVLNNIVLLVGSLLLYLGLRMLPAESLPSLFRAQSSLSFEWKFLLPGAAGLFIIIVAPLAISKVGAVRVFVGIVAAQLVASLLWDKLVDGLPITAPKLIGSALAIAGTILAAWE